MLFMIYIICIPVHIFVEMHDDGKELTPDITLDKLLRILEQNTFVSGAHIDYYDD